MLLKCLEMSGRIVEVTIIGNLFYALDFILVLI